MIISDEDSVNSNELDNSTQVSNESFQSEEIRDKQTMLKPLPRFDSKSTEYESSNL